MPRRIPDLTKIGAAIGWKATIPLSDILQHVIDHCRRS
jgi:hypothetical protein